MKYVIGIDGGGTKSVINIADLNGKIISRGLGGPTNIKSASLDEVHTVLKELMENAVSKSGLLIDDCASVCIGTAGVHELKGESDVAALIKSIGIKGNVIVTNDAEIVLAAESKDVEGVVLIAGTGSIAYGIDRYRKRYRSGGWGHILGDEGSGYYIGLEGIKAALKCYDGREPYTELLPMLEQEMGVLNVEGMVDRIYKKDLKKSEIAYYSKTVNKAFENGDKKAEEILQNSSSELFMLVDAVIKAMKYENVSTTVVVNGSVIVKNNFIFNSFTNLAKDKYPLINIKKLSKEAAYGASRIALKALKIQ